MGPFALAERVVVEPTRVRPEHASGMFLGRRAKRVEPGASAQGRAIRARRIASNPTLSAAAPKRPFAFGEERGCSSHLGSTKACQWHVLGRRAQRARRAQSVRAGPSDSRQTNREQSHLPSPSDPASMERAVRFATHAALIPAATLGTTPSSIRLGHPPLCIAPPKYSPL
jgi:hypothetical protein